MGELAGAVALLISFAVVEMRKRNPLFPLSIFRINGLAAADATQVIAQAGSRSVDNEGNIGGARGWRTLRFGELWFGLYSVMAAGERTAAHAEPRCVKVGVASRGCEEVAGAT
jgi:hypothetical protein